MEEGGNRQERPGMSSAGLPKTAPAGQDSLMHCAPVRAKKINSVDAFIAQNRRGEVKNNVTKTSELVVLYTTSRHL